MTPSRSHLVVIPSYNPGPQVFETVRAARAQWSPTWVVVDGSTDGTAEALVELAARDPGLKVLVLPANRGKGAAVFCGFEAARAAGYTHALTMDSDGQHPAELIGAFMAASANHPDAMVLKANRAPDTLVDATSCAIADVGSIPTVSTTRTVRPKSFQKRREVLGLTR